MTNILTKAWSCKTNTVTTLQWSTTLPYESLKYIKYVIIVSSFLHLFNTLVNHLIIILITQVRISYLLFYAGGNAVIPLRIYYMIQLRSKVNGLWVFNMVVSIAKSGIDLFCLNEAQKKTAFVWRQKDSKLIQGDRLSMANFSLHYNMD